jgi:hypothetical protein
VPRQVRRTDDAVAAREVVVELAPRPDVVAERDDVGAGGEQPIGELGRDSPPVGGVLSVDDAEGRAELLAEPAQALLDRAAPRRAEDVGDEEELYGSDSVAAGRTSIVTWLPASCV